MIDEWDETEVADLEDEYVLMGELGRGGSAIVYRARDRSLGREVAIKVVRPRPGAASDDAIARLAREARTVAKLQHANIVTVHAVKRLREGGLALVMQLVPGRTLKQAITDDGPMSAEQTERILRDVAQALSFAHTNGVVHRDVKPENIFIDGTTGRAMLSDFGIAHNTEFDSRLTMTGAAIGTPAYMAPEQIDGAPANARSDVYSLGLVAWEMLTGERPWEGETLYNVIWKQKHDDLPAIDELRPGAVPPRLQYIVERMLQKKPAARWAGADGLLGSLTAWVVPSDWRQWEEAHHRRRERAKAAAKSLANARPNTSLETVRFTRPAPGAPPTPSEGAALPKRQSAVTAARATPADDAIPSWASEPVDTSRRQRILLLGALAVVITGGAVALYAMRDRFSSTTTGSSAAITDVGTVQLPIIRPTADSLNRNVRDSLARSAAESSAIEAAARAAVGSANSGTGGATTASPGGPPIGAPTSTAKPGTDIGASSSTPPPNTAANAAASGAVNATGTQPRDRRQPTPIIPAPPGVSAPMPALTPPVAAPTVHATDDRGIIAAGGRHTCVLSVSRVFCWGSNDQGQLGNGEVDSRETPAGIVGDLDFLQISAGVAHSCGVTKSGDAYCWGNDENGQLGDNTTTSRSAPVRVGGNLSFQQVHAGKKHTCGLTTSGEVACWGLSDNGQLGDGSSSLHSSPVMVSTRLRFISLSVGWNHSCAIATDGVAYCWGDNANGQLGDGTHIDQRTPVPIGGALRFTSIAGGSGHTCAVTDVGEVYCWGRNAFGQLGTGGTADHPLPTRVETSVRFVSVTLGGVYSCGRTRGGQAWCWGQNLYGQLGDGTTADHDVPVRVVAGVAFASINASGAHTCGTTAEGETHCWGYNIEGQLGDGTRNHHTRPTRVTLPGR